MNFIRNFGFYIVKRVLLLIPLLIGMTLVAFFLIRVGDANPATLIAGPTASAAEIERVEQDLGLADPIIVQYGNYVADAMRGEFGRSWMTGRAVSEEMTRRLPITLEVVLLGTVVSVILGLAMGFVSGMREGQWPDHLLRVFSLGGISMPIFWLGLLMILVFFTNMGVAPPPLGRLNLFLTAPDPVTGFPLLDAALRGEWEVFRSLAAHLVLPVLTIALVIGATIGKQTRASVIEVRSSKMVRYARACGMPTWRVWLLVLHNSLPSVITFIAISFSLQLGGSVLVEVIFSWGGLGQLGVTAIQRADFAVVQAYILIMGILAAGTYLIADLIIAVIDPRVSYR